MSFLEGRLGVGGRTAVIVGGGGGLGRAIALDLGRAGMNLVLCDRNTELLHRTAHELVEDGVEVVTVEGDARTTSVLEHTFSRADESFGRVDVSVNVVGGTFRSLFADTSARGWDTIIRTNFSWILDSTQLAIRRMRDAGGGSIINVTSIEGHRAAPGYAVYAAMKAAVESLTRSLAVELGQYGIRVNTIAPDMIPTEGALALSPPDAPQSGMRDDELGRQAVRTSVPIGRLGTYEDVGGCALFLASRLSSYITGTSLHADGGTLASSGWFDWPESGWSNVPPPSAFAWMSLPGDGSLATSPLLG